MPFKKKEESKGNCRFCDRKIGKSYYMIGIKKTRYNRICPNCANLFTQMKNAFLSNQQGTLRRMFTYIYDNIKEVRDSRLNKVI